MHGQWKKVRTMWLAALSAGVIGTSAAMAQPADKFYEGKTIRIIVRKSASAVASASKPALRCSSVTPLIIC